MAVTTLGGCRWDGSHKLRWEDGDCVGDFTWKVRIIRLCWEFGDDQDCAGRSSGGNTGWGYHWQAYQEYCTGSMRITMSKYDQF